MEYTIERIKKEDSKSSLKGNPDLKSAQNELVGLVKSLDRMADCSANDVENTLASVRATIKNFQGEPYQERGAKGSKNLGQFAKAVALDTKALTKIGKKMPQV